MRHPSLEILQDYFENALVLSQEKRVKDHLLICDQCSKMLADFAVIETKVLRRTAPAISAQAQQRIFTDAKKMLAQREQRKMAHTERQERLKELLQDWQEKLSFDWRVPALQFASLSLVLAVVAAVETNQTEETTYQPISTDVQVLTYQDVTPQEGE
jgi:anti-sigma factor ChrR (cupin superfamily)